MTVGSLRAWSPTIVRSDLSRARSAISSASRRFAPRGHSQKVGLPARNAFMTRSWCPGTRTQTTTRSMSGCLTMSSMLWNANAAPYFSAEALAVASCAVHTALSSYSGNACNAGTCALAPQPLPPGVTVAPTIPTRILPAMSDDIVGLEPVEVRGAERQPLLVDLAVVLAQQRRGPYLGRRLRELHRVRRHRERAPARMLDGRDHAARDQVRVAQDLLGHQHGARGHAGLPEIGHDLVLRARHRPGLDEGVDLVLVGGAPLRIRPLRVADQVRASDRLEQGVPHVRAHGLAVDVGVVVAAARLAPIDARGRRGRDLVTASRLEVAPRVREPHGDAGEIDDGVLHGALDALAMPRRLPLPESGHHAQCRVHARARVADGGTGLERRRAREAGQRHRAARRLRDHVEALVLAVGTVGAEALHGEIDQARIQGREGLVAEAHPLHPAGRLVLGHDVGPLDHVEEHGLALRVLEVERDALLVGVEQEEVARVDAGFLGATVPPGLPLAGLLDLDDLGAEPREHLGARRAGLELGEVQDADAVQRCAHRLPPTGIIPRGREPRRSSSAQSPTVGGKLRGPGRYTRLHNGGTMADTPILMNPLKE